MANTILIKSKTDGAGAPAHGAGLKVAELAVNTSNTLATAAGRGNLFLGVTAESATNATAGTNTAAAYNADQSGGIVWVGAPILNESGLTSNDATKLATQASIKSYVDDQLTASDLDAATDSGTIDIALGSETLTISGGEGIDTSATGTTITIAGEEASTSNKGVASFSSDNFAVSSGVVTIKDDGVALAELSATGTASSSTFLRGDNSWAAPSSGAVTAINNATANELVTIGSTTTELDAEANLTYDGNNMVLAGTTPSITIGDGGAEDAKLVFDGNATDFYVGLDDSADDLIIGRGSTVGTTPSISIDTSDNVTITGDLTITGDDLFMGTNTDKALLVGDGTNFNPVVSSGDVVIASNGAATIQAQAVENSMLADDAVGADELAANAVVNASVATGAAIALSKIDTNVDMGGNYTIGSQSDDVATFGGGVTVTGDLTVSGTTTTVNSTTVSIADPIFELGASASDDNLDRGIKMKYNSSGAKIAFIGFDDSDGKFVMIPDATDTSSVFTGTQGNLKADLTGDVTGDLSGTATTVTVTDSTANTDFPIAFHNESNGLLDDTGAFEYNPSTGKLTVTKISAYTQDGSVDFSDEAMTNVNIDSGAIDGTNVTVGSGKTLDVSGGTLTLANDQISGDAITGGTIGATTITTLTLGSMGGNWTNASRTIADLGVVTTVDINGGSIDGATIATSDVTVGSGKTLNVSAGTLTTSTAQKKAIVEGVGSSFDVGNFTMTANGLTIDGTFTDGTMSIASGAISSATIDAGSYTAA